MPLWIFLEKIHDVKQNPSNSVCGPKTNFTINSVLLTLFKGL
jgi:hypothetical protein